MEEYKAIQFEKDKDILMNAAGIQVISILNMTGCCKAISFNDQNKKIHNYLYDETGKPIGGNND